MHGVVGVATQDCSVGLTLAAASAIALSAPHAGALPPPGFPSLDAFTAVPADGYLEQPARREASPRVSFLRRLRPGL